MPFAFSPRESLFWNARQVPSNYFLLHVTEQIPQRGHLKCVLFPQLLPAQSIGVLGLFSFRKGANLGSFPFDSSTLACSEFRGFQEHTEHPGSGVFSSAWNEMTFFLHLCNTNLLMTLGTRQRMLPESSCGSCKQVDLAVINLDIRLSTRLIICKD